MTARLDSVCRYICEKGGWKVSNLQLQKLLYLAQMVHLGEHGERLTDADFQAWDYGPVEPTVYRKVRMFGSGPISDVFYDARAFKADDQRKKSLDLVCDQLLSVTPGRLVDITHWDKGAWVKNYVPGFKGLTIPDADIVAEYHARSAKRAAQLCT